MIKSRDMKISDTYDGEVWDMVLDVPAEKEVFISYSSKDFERVNRIKEILETNGISCWMAPQCIPAGSNYAREIPAAIKNCKVFLLMLTSRSQESQWVPKELSLALSEGKCVLPFMLENCALTEMFNFYLTDVQRVYHFEVQSESLRELTDRIRRECGAGGENSEGSPFQHISAVEAWVAARDRSLLSRELSMFLTALRRQYRENPNAEVAAQWISRYQIGAFQVEAVLGALERCGLFLPSAAEIAVQEAVIFIHSGDRKYIKRARRLLNTAVKIYLGQKAYDETAFKRIIYARWLIAVTYKQERNFGCANELCEDLIAYIEDENQVFGIPYSDSLLLPQRELLVINKEEVMSDYLTFHMEDIRMNPKELFYTQRRMLELHILNNDFEKARALLPELLQSFEKCRNYVDEIYHVGLYQNLFEYYSYVGDKEEAERYYRLALENARKNFWKGKEKKLSTLRQIFE